MPRDDNHAPTEETARERHDRQRVAGQLEIPPEVAKRFADIARNLQTQSAIVGRALTETNERNRQQLQALLRVKEAYDRKAFEIGQGLRGATDAEREARVDEAATAAVANTERIGELIEVVRNGNEMVTQAVVDLADQTGEGSKTATKIGVLVVVGTLLGVVIAVTSLVVSLTS